MNTFTCPICGFPELTFDPQASEDAGLGEACPSCDYKFISLADTDPKVRFWWRFGWITDGKPFRAEGRMPVSPNWDPERQLEEMLEKERPTPPPRPWTCPVCGYPALTRRPRSPGGGGSYDFCPSCDFEFGVTDDDLGISDEEWRSRWVAQGMPWSDQDWPQPPDWDPKRQLGRLLESPAD